MFTVATTIKKCQYDSRSCVVVNIEFMLKLYICHCYPGVMGIWKNSNTKSKMLKIQGLVKKKITYMKQIKIQWFHMDVIFMPKHLIWRRIQGVYIPSLIMHSHTGNVYCGVVLTVNISIFLTKKQITSFKKQHPQFGFTFITSLHVVLLMVEFHWKTKKYVTCVNKNFQQMYLQKYTPEKS